MGGWAGEGWDLWAGDSAAEFLTAGAGDSELWT